MFYLQVFAVLVVFICIAALMLVGIERHINSDY